MGIIDREEAVHQIYRRNLYQDMFERSLSKAAAFPRMPRVVQIQHSNGNIREVATAQKKAEKKLVMNLILQKPHVMLNLDYLVWNKKSPHRFLEAVTELPLPPLHLGNHHHLLLT